MFSIWTGGKLLTIYVVLSSSNLYLCQLINDTKTPAASGTTNSNTTKIYPVYPIARLPENVVNISSAQPTYSVFENHTEYDLNITNDSGIEESKIKPKIEISSNYQNTMPAKNELPDRDSKPFLPSPTVPFEYDPFTPFAPIVRTPPPNRDDSFSKPVHYEHFYNPNFPTFGNVRNYNSVRPHGFSNELPISVPHTSNGDVNFRNTPKTEITSNVVGYKSPEFDFFGGTGISDQKPVVPTENELIQTDWLHSEDTKNKFYTAKSRLKQKKKAAVLQTLSTLIPLVLLLAAIPPNILIMNSTESNRKTAATRSEIEDSSETETDLYRSPISYLVENLGATPSLEEDCNKLYLCEEALNGSTENATFQQHSIWLLLSRGMELAQEKLNLQDIVTAIQNKECHTSFKCQKAIIEKIRTYKLSSKVDPSPSMSIRQLLNGDI